MAGKSPYAIELTIEERAELDQRAACMSQPAVSTLVVTGDVA